MAVTMLLVKAIAASGIPNVVGTRQPIADDTAKRPAKGFQSTVEQ